MAPDSKSQETKQKDDYVGDIRFYPPLYQQRYCLAVKFLEERKVKSVVDFGCAECKLIPMIRRIPHIEEVLGVDIDRDLLSSRQYALKPLLADYILPREKPLRIRLLEGNISEFDERLQNMQAVTMVEVIEHLTSDVLADFPTVVFGRLQPEFVLITTPNSEFNVLFANFSGMRHDDHKFEWTREQFKAWCSRVCDKFPYDVEYGGVGDPPEERHEVGHCSQFAIFTRHEPRVQSQPTPETQQETPYSMVMEVDYPHRERQGEEAELLIEATYQIRQAVFRLDNPDPDDDNYYGCGSDDSSTEYYIPLEEILTCYGVKKLCSDINKLRTVLDNAGYTLSENRNEVIMKRYEDEDEVEDLWGSDYVEEEQQDVEPVSTSETWSEEQWSDGDDERCQQARAVIPYCEMWEDAEECGSRLDIPATERPTETELDMVYVPAVLHAPPLPRVDRNGPVVDGQFADDFVGFGPSVIQPCASEHLPRKVAAQKDKPQFEVSVEAGQFDDVDECDLSTKGNTVICSQLKRIDFNRFV